MHSGVVLFVWIKTMTNTSQNNIEYGSGIIVKQFDDKIIICAENTTKFHIGEHTIEGKGIIIEGEKSIKITSRHPNVLVISQDTTKQDEAIFDLKEEMNKRLETIEKVFAKILKTVKQ